MGFFLGEVADGGKETEEVGIEEEVDKGVNFGIAVEDEEG